MAFEKSNYDVVLVYPPAPAIVEVYDLPDFPNIGIAYVGDYLERNCDITPALIDARFSRYSIDETVEQIVNKQPKIVGFGAMTHMVVTVAEVSRKVKARLPEVKVVLGGFHATFMPERTLEEFPIFDYIVVGEGEMAFSNLTTALLNSDTDISIPGVWYMNDAIANNNGRGQIPATLDELGSPGWRLYDQDEIDKYCQSLPVMGQRGCPFSCTFCSRPYGQKVRKRTPQLIADEVAANISRYNVKTFHFYDETFSVDKKHTTALCQALITHGVPKTASWTSTIHANTITQELADLIKEAGCSFTGYGVETGDDTIMAQMNKGVSKQKIIKARNILKKAGITTSTYFMLGHPNETRKSILKTIMFAVRLNPDTAAIGIMVPYPGTKIWELASKGEGGYVKLSSNWEDFNKQLGNAVQLKNISRREIELYQLIAYASIYLFNFRFLDLLKITAANFNLLCSMVVKIVLPTILRKRLVLFQNAGGHTWKERQRSHLIDNENKTGKKLGSSMVKSHSVKQK